MSQSMAEYVTERAMAEGREQATREALITFLTARFGELPSGIQAAIDEANIDIVNSWLPLAGTVQILDDIGIRPTERRVKPQVSASKLRTQDDTVTMFDKMKEYMEECVASAGRERGRNALKIILATRSGEIPPELVAEIDKMDFESAIVCMRIAAMA